LIYGRVFFGHRSPPGSTEPDVRAGPCGMQSRRAGRTIELCLRPRPSRGGVAGGGRRRRPLVWLGGEVFSSVRRPQASGGTPCANGRRVLSADVKRFFVVSPCHGRCTTQSGRVVAVDWQPRRRGSGCGQPASFSVCRLAQSPATWFFSFLFVAALPGCVIRVVPTRDCFWWPAPHANVCSSAAAFVLTENRQPTRAREPVLGGRRRRRPATGARSAPHRGSRCRLMLVERGRGTP